MHSSHVNVLSWILLDHVLMFWYFIIADTAAEVLSCDRLLQLQLFLHCIMFMLSVETLTLSPAQEVQLQINLQLTVAQLVSCALSLSNK